MGTRADRNKGITRFVADLLENQGLILFEKWFAHLQKLAPNQKILDSDVRDKMLEEIVTSVSLGNSLILGKKDKLMVEELLNRFLLRFHLLNTDLPLK
jgi:hypothetical protein